MRLMNVLFVGKVNPSTMGPMKYRLRSAKDTLYFMPKNKLWYCGGYNSAAIAAELINKGKIIALPTDTIYGLAGLAQDESSVAKLYEIKERDSTKPFAICLADVKDISNWAHTEDLPEGLLEELLPGPTTLILKRKNTLNQTLNPGLQNIGIRVPKFNFVLSVVKMVNQPLALTSANKSGAQSSLHPSEFQDLWPQLDGVFYEKMNTNNMKSFWRKGSTIVDLTLKGEYEILRSGIGRGTTEGMLKKFNLKRHRKEDNNDKTINSKNESEEESQDSEDEKVKGQALN